MIEDIRTFVLGLGPLPLWLWIVLAVVILLGCIFLIWQLWRLGARRAGVPEEAEEEAPKPANAFLPQAIREAFVDAHRWLRSVFPGRDYRYAAPVFLLIGEGGVGKSTLLRSVGMGRALRDTADSEPVNWYFFDRGAIIDSRGDVLGLGDDPGSDSGPWDTLIQAFQNYRAERPLDGLILMAPVTDFVGPNRLSKEEILAKAEALHRRVGRLQNRVGMQLPIYIVLSKCDSLEGFAAAAALFDEQSRDEALGWSSPYSPDSAFVPTWTGEAIDTIYEKVSEAIVEALAVSAEESESGQAFLFPGSIRRIEEGLRPFLANLLRVSAYNRSGSLRGIYLTGAPVGSVAHDEFSVRDIGYQTGGAAPIFARGLLDRKIFPEYALARPFSLSLLSSNRNVRLAQGAMAAMLVLAVAGIWYTDSWLTRTTQNLANVAEGVLRKVRSLDEARAAGLRPDQKLLEQSTLPLLLNLGEADRRNLISLAVPGSWVSGLPDSVDLMLDKAFQVILFRSMHDSLVARLENIEEEADRQKQAVLQASQDATAPGHSSASRQYVPYPDYSLLTDFVSDLQALSRNVDLYNSLRTTDSTFAVSSVVEYLYGLQLSDQFFANVGSQLFDGARNGNLTPIDVTDYQKEAQSGMAEIASAFLKDLETRYDLLTNSQQLVRLIDQAGVSREPIASLQILKQIETLALQIRSSVQSGRYDWALGPQLDLGGAFGSVTDRIRSTALLGPQVADGLQTQAQQTYNDFRANLLQTVSRSIGPIFVEDKGTITVSPALEELDQRLSGLPNLLAATSAGNGIAAVELPTSPPPGSYVVWDIQTLDDAVDASRRLASLEIQGAAPGSGSSSSNNNLGVGQIVNREIAGRLVSSVAQAATLQRLPYSSGSLGYEALVGQRVQNFSQAASRLDRIIGFFDALGADGYRDQIQRLQAQSAYSILQAADDLLQQTSAYEPRDGDFGWWDGSAGAALEAYNVNGTGELTAYLGLQRQRIAFIAQNYAEPVLVYLLNLRVNVAGVDIKTLTKWTKISQDLARYQAKVPDSSIEQLETYIQGPMMSVTSENCQPAVIDLAGADSQDYFVARLRSVSAAFATRCFDQANLQVADGFDAISNAFNRNLAGQFPFAAKVPTAGQGNEASLSGVLRYLNQFNVYMNLGAGDPTRWAGVSKDVRDPALQFLNQMDEVNEVFAAGMSGQGTQTTFAYDLQVAFRVERQLEIGAAQLVEWSLSSGGTKVDQFTAANRLPWKFGDPISVAFTWALNGQTRPTRGAGVPPNFVIADRTASFEFKGDWALFELVNAQAMSGSLQSPDSGGSGTVLQFDIPIEPFTDPQLDSDPIPSDKLPKAARLFIEITVFGSKDQGTPRIQMPSFPTAAPVAKSPTAAASKPAAAPVTAVTGTALPSTDWRGSGQQTGAAPATSGAAPAGTATNVPTGRPRPIYPTNPGNAGSSTGGAATGTTQPAAPAAGTGAGSGTGSGSTGGGSTSTGSGTSAGGRPPSGLSMYDVWRDTDPTALDRLDPLGTASARNGYAPPREAWAAEAYDAAWARLQRERSAWAGRPWREPPRWDQGGWSNGQGGQGVAALPQTGPYGSDPYGAASYGRMPYGSAPAPAYDPRAGWYQPEVYARDERRLWPRDGVFGQAETFVPAPPSGELDGTFYRRADGPAAAAPDSLFRRLFDRQ